MLLDLFLEGKLYVVCRLASLQSLCTKLLSQLPPDQGIFNPTRLALHTVLMSAVLSKLTTPSMHSLAVTQEVPSLSNSLRHTHCVDMREKECKIYLCHSTSWVLEPAASIAQP